MGISIVLAHNISYFSEPIHLNTDQITFFAKMFGSPGRLR